MRAKAIEVAWHDELSIWSVDCCKKSRRFVTAGADKTARVWHLEGGLEHALESEESKPKAQATEKSGESPTPAAPRHSTPLRRPRPLVRWVADLSGHSSTVNVVRFAPCGSWIASGSDQGEVILWKYSGPSNDPRADRPREVWSLEHIIRGHCADVLDLSWSRDSKQLFSASVDNTVRVWSITDEKAPNATVFPHSSLVQGVATDPRLQLVAAMGSDRSLTVRCMSTLSLTGTALTDQGEPKSHLFASTLNCNILFRRLSWSPDGSILACPTGIEVPSTTSPASYAVHCFARDQYLAPVFQCCGMKKLPSAVRFCPRLFQLRRPDVPKTKSKDEALPPLVDLPYRMIFAVACPDMILMYDTESLERPFAQVAGIHYAEITDVAWSSDGLSVLVSSADGCVSVIAFKPGELGTELPTERWPECMQSLGQNTIETTAKDAKPEFEPVTPEDVAPLEVHVREPTSPPADASTRQIRVAGPADRCDGVREIVVVAPRRKSKSSEKQHRNEATSDVETPRKRLRLDDE